MIDRLLNVLPPVLANFVWTLPGVAARAPVLALAHDGFCLHGALLARRGKGLALLGTGTSRAVSFAAGLGEVLAQTGGRPRQAVLATVSALAALLDLPVEAEHPKPAREMEGLVRWELEPLMAEQIGLWNLGALLEGRGYLDADGRAAVVTELAQRHAEANALGARGGQPPIRFGEAALALGLVRREQVEECLALQTQLQNIDDQVVCAWAPRGLTADRGRALWLAAGMGMAVQSRWIEACQRHGLRLEAIVPLAGAGFPLAPATGAVVEAHSAQVLVARLREGRPERLASRPLEGQAPLAVLRSLLSDLLEPDDKAIHLFAPRPDGAALGEALAAEFGRPVPALPAGVAATSAAAPWLPALVGVARQILRPEEASMPRLPGAEPLPPPLRRPQIWAVMGGAAFVLLVAGYELSAWGRMAWMQRQLSELTGAKSKREQETARAEEHKRQARELTAQVNKLKQEERLAQSELEFYRSELGGRGQFVSGALKALAEAVSSEVVVDALVESSWFTLSVNAWSLSQSAAYRFAKDVAASLAPWRFEVRDIQVKAQAGRKGRAGYAVQFKLMRPAPVSEAVAPQAPQGKNP